MNNLKKCLVAFGILLISTSCAFSKNVKAIKPKTNNTVEINISQFGKYLDDENSNSIEGVYKTEDERYLIAIIKNDEKTHDYIGVVISADNKFWKHGEVKFNFVIGEDGTLRGLYYDSRGEGHSMQFALNENGIESDLLKKVQVEELRSKDLALH